jgi:hypothetical protein
VSTSGLRGVCVAVLMSLLLVGGGAAQTPERPLIVGYLRVDGIVVPYAVFNGTDWRAIRSREELARHPVPVWNYRL